ncbi:MAG: hypothetical protein Q4A97_02710, partial [Comamonadaceae bacterium]|nr:hypothetical protein [Comamonadaceae bacterium]
MNALPPHLLPRAPQSGAPAITRRRAAASLAALAASACLPARAAHAANVDKPMRVGITLHPYFSFVSH